jgi:hypothetical protein
MTRVARSSLRLLLRLSHEPGLGLRGLILLMQVNAVVDRPRLRKRYRSTAKEEES